MFELHDHICLDICQVEKPDRFETEGIKLTHVRASNVRVIAFAR